MISIEIRNLERLNRLARGGSNIRVGVYGMLEKELLDTGNRIQRQAKLNVTAGGPSGSGLRVRTGRLRASINTVLDKSSDSFKLTVGAAVPYARIHELGGETGSKKGRFYMRARPYLFPAVAQEYPRLVQRTKEALRQIAMEGLSGQ